MSLSAQKPLVESLNFSQVRKLTVSAIVRCRVLYNKSAQAREHSKRMWSAAAERLNSLGDGAIKSASERSKVCQYLLHNKSVIKLRHHKRVLVS